MRQLFGSHPACAIGHHAVCKSHGKGFRRADAAARQNHVESARLPDKARQAHRAAVNQRHAPSAAEHTEDGALLGHAQIAPQRQFQSACHGMAADRCNDGLGKAKARRPHRRADVEPIRRIGGRNCEVPAAGSNGFQVGARAECAARAPQYGDVCALVVFELQERLGQRFRRGAVHGVAHIRAVQNHGCHRSVALDQHACAHSRISLHFASRTGLKRRHFTREAIPVANPDTFKSRKTLTVNGKSYVYFSLAAAEKNGLKGISRLPYSLNILLENLLRYENGVSVTASDIRAVAAWLDKRSSEREIAFRPARVLMQDLTGVPAVVDLAAMRDAMKNLGGDPEKINPLAEVDLVIDHSVMVDVFGRPDSFKRNVQIEYQRNGERYAFLRWGQQAFANFSVVPPGTGICHQVNLEYLGQTVWTRKIREGKKTVEYAFPDTLVGTDSHTTMINGLAVLGWGVGGIEAEAAMLGQPISMLIPEVIGFRLSGRLREGVTATDLVLTVTEMLRKKGVVGKFVEFTGPGLDELALEDRATIANMAPEYGATCGFFPIDAETIRYLKATGRKPDRIALVEKYAKAQGMWRDKKTP